MLKSCMVLVLALTIEGLTIDMALAQNHNHYEGRGGGEKPIGSIAGIVQDAAGQPAEYATVSVFRMRDSTLSTGAITDAEGKFKIETSAGRYYLKIESLSFTPKILTNVKVHPDQLEVNLQTISVSERTSNLEEVEISAEKSQVEIGLDKKVFNVQKDLSSVGGNAADVLENVPSVIVDVDGKVSLRGSENVRILIDGKPSGLMGISPAKALEQISASTIESIEIITNPSVRYDAEGIAGIINIILKKNRANGFNGMLNMTTGYPHRHNANLTFNYKVNKVNLFGTLGVRYRQRPGSIIYHRETTVNDTITTLDQDGDFTRGGLSYTYRLGTDYFISKKSTVTVSAGISPSSSLNDRNTDYRTYDYNNVLQNLSTRSTIDNDEESSLDLNFGYVQHFKKKLQSFTFDIRYSSGLEDGFTEMDEEYELLDYVADHNNSLSQRTNDLKKQSNLVIEAGYTYPLAGAAKLEFGYKTGIQNKDLDFLVEEFNDSSQTWLNLTDISNHFIYDEVIHAAYGIYSNKIKKFSYKVGLRAEQTYVTTALIETNEVYDKEYLHFFPSVHLSRKLKKENQIQLSYSRRIKRPRSGSLIPFTSYADPLNLWIGNPDLNPQLTNSFEIGHLKFWESASIGTSIYYRHTDSVVTRIRTIDSNGVSTTRPENLNKQDEFGIELTFSKDITYWWKFNGSFNYFRSILDGGNLNSTYNVDAFSYTGRVNSTMTLTNGFQLQIMYNYRGRRVTAQGSRLAMSFVDIGLKKSLLNKRGSLTLRLSDAFNSRRFVFETYVPSFFIQTKYRHSTRGIFLNLTYKINRYKAKRRKGRAGYDMQDMGM
ncbi:MAG: TonB-dependent receptor [Flavobacteriales bacterium]|nr:TonB-dependent receptor [Flavobacteriales bacterium]